MAKFGAYRFDKTSGRYRDRSTGRFIAQAEVERLNTIASTYRRLGSLEFGSDAAIIDSIATKYGTSVDDARSAYANWLRAYADAQASGDDPPEFASIYAELLG